MSNWLKNWIVPIIALMITLTGAGWTYSMQNQQQVMTTVTRVAVNESRIAGIERSLEEVKEASMESLRTQNEILHILKTRK